jgi:hypothetical protein
VPVNGILIGVQSCSASSDAEKRFQTVACDLGGTSARLSTQISNTRKSAQDARRKGVISLGPSCRVAKDVSHKSQLSEGLTSIAITPLVLFASSFAKLEITPRTDEILEDRVRLLRVHRV